MNELKRYETPCVEIVQIKLSQDILTASQESPIPIHTDPQGETDPPIDEDIFD